MLLDLGGKNVLERCLENMSPFCDRIIIVGGHRFEDLKSKFKSCPRVELVYNRAYCDGMFSSVCQGVSQVQAARFFLCPGDYPLITRQTYVDLLSVQEAIVVPTCKHRPGHPVLISGDLVSDILQGGYTCLKDFVRANNPVFLETEDPGVLMDIDTREDYESMVPLFSVNHTREFGRREFLS
jgi:molybdenum cofactor cytidylyltransferase